MYTINLFFILLGYKISSIYSVHTEPHSCSISISSTHFFIPPVAPPVVAAKLITSTTIQLSWSSSGSMLNSYEVMWQKTASRKCHEKDTDNGSTTVFSTSYNVTGLDEDSRYIFTVKAIDATGSNALSIPITAVTMEAGIIINVVI